MILEAEPYIEVVGYCADCVQAWEIQASQKPDVALMDIRMPPARWPRVERQVMETATPTTPT